MTKPKFAVGDIVEAFGVRGEVIKNNSYTDDKYSIRVKFAIDNTIVYFLKDGRLFDWHREPSLKLIERPKPKEPREIWVNKYEEGFRLSCIHECEEAAKAQSRTRETSYIRTIRFREVLEDE